MGTSSQQQPFPAADIPVMMRSLIFSMMLGLHNALEQEDATLEDLRIRFHTEYRQPMENPLGRPERCFFWAQSSLLN